MLEKHVIDDSLVIFEVHLEKLETFHNCPDIFQTDIRKIFLNSAIDYRASRFQKRTHDFIVFYRNHYGEDEHSYHGESSDD